MYIILYNVLILISINTSQQSSFYNHETGSISGMIMENS